MRTSPKLLKFCYLGEVLAHSLYTIRGGKQQISENSKNKGSVRGRPYTEVGEGKYDVHNKILLSKWIKCFLKLKW